MTVAMQGEDEAQSAQGGADVSGSRDKLWSLLLAVISVLPFYGAKPAFRSDDVLLIAQGYETSVLAAFFRAFLRPFGDTSAIEFYRRSLVGILRSMRPFLVPIHNPIWW